MRARDCHDGLWAPFCEVHGKEAKVGALEELYQDAREFLERLDNPHVPMPNEEAARVLEEAIRALPDTHTDEATIREAYPLIPEKVCMGTRTFDYWDESGEDPPAEVYMNARNALHKHMRLAYQEGMDWLVEQLEYERESVSAQASFAFADMETKRA